jgi:diguanylate cyclase (GGDEF)-like protein
MKQVAMKATFVALMSILSSVAIGSVLFPGPYLLFDGKAWTMCIICPLVIAWPASAYTFWQKDKLHAALSEVQRAHDELAQAHRLLAEKARRDDMTGMLNRETFFTMFEKARFRSGIGMLLIIDADNFKQINDNHGHLTGDAALLQICAAIERTVRRGDIVGRIGGEEFGVFLTGADRTTSLQVAERIREEVARIEFRIGDDERIPLSVSIGGASHRPAATLSELMREADRKLYEAKRRGRNRVIFTDVPAAA